MSGRVARGRRGLTLVELVLSTAVLGILIGAMSIGVLMTVNAARASLDRSSGGTDSADGAAMIAAELRLARSFSERSSHAAQFSVPDRDGDGLPQQVRLEWSGTDGDPLLRSIDGGPAVAMVDSIEQLDLSYLLVTTPDTAPIDWPEFTSARRLLMVVADASALRNDELARRMLFEQWGYTVAVISASAPQGDIDVAVADAHVAFVPAHIDEAALGTKLRLAAVGVVFAAPQLVQAMGLSSNAPGDELESTVQISDASHYITSVFPDPTVALTLTPQQLFTHTGVGGLARLADVNGSPSLLALEAGAELKSGGPAPAHRVAMPWGDASFDFTQLGDDARTMLKRALEWAGAGESGPPSLELVYSLDDNPSESNHSYEIRDNSWAAASVLPPLPPTATGWSVNAVALMLRREGSATETLLVQIRARGPDGAPTSTILAQRTLFESGLPADFAWVEVPLETGLMAPTEGVCVVVGMTSGDYGGEVFYEKEPGGSGTPHNRFYRGRPGQWVAPGDRDIPVHIQGVVMLEDGG